MASKSRTPSQQLLLGISGLRDGGKFTDLVFTHTSGSFDVHRIIVCPQSKVFYKACTGGFEEKSTGVIEMGHVSHVQLKKMVNFFYNMDYDEDMPEGTDMTILQLHARMFALADQYDIPGLSLVAARRYSSRCATSWEPLEFLSSIRDVYEMTPNSIRPLRDAACITIRRNLPEMLDDKVTAECYDSTVTENPEFAKDLLRSYISTPVFSHCSYCGSTQVMEALQMRCRSCKKGRSGTYNY